MLLLPLMAAVAAAAAGKRCLVDLPHEICEGDNACSAQRFNLARMMREGLAPCLEDAHCQDNGDLGAVCEDFVCVCGPGAGPVAGQNSCTPTPNPTPAPTLNPTPAPTNEPTFSSDDHELIFKLTTGTEVGNASEFWESGTTDEVNVRDPRISNWADLRVKELRVSIVKNGAERQHITFGNPSFTDNMAWFSQENVIDSSYFDIKTEVNNHFSITGSTGSGRAFYISRNHGGCEADAGWLVVDDNVADPCNWEKREGSGVHILYAAHDSYENWTTGSIHEADSIEIYATFYDNEFHTAFKLVDADAQFDAVAFWNSGGIVGEGDANAMNPADGTARYRSSLMDAFKTWTGDARVRLDIYKDGAVQKSVSFRAPAGTMADDSWMATENIYMSDWSDLGRGAEHNYMGIVGHGEANRHFYMNKNYGGCSVDAGWLVVIDQLRQGCDWEEVHDHVSILYSPDDTAVNWTNGDVTEADSLVFSFSLDNPTPEPTDSPTPVPTPGPTVSPTDSPTGEPTWNAGDDWKLLYRITDGSALDPNDLWVNGGGNDVDVRDAVVGQWSENYVSRIRVSVVKDGAERAYMVFKNPSAADNTGWFSQANLERTSWTDLAASEHNHFAIGSAGSGRDWYISRNHGGCSVDAGWLVVDSASDGDPCAWEGPAGETKIIYAVGDTFENWTTGNVAFADSLEVYAEVSPLSTEFELMVKIADGQANYDTVAFFESGGSYPGNANPADKADRYRSEMFDWVRTYPDDAQVKLDVYKGGAIVQSMTFAAPPGSLADDSWFATENIYDTTWDDLTEADIEHNYFSIDGHGSVSRHYFMSKNYGGCGVDAGYLVVMDNDDRNGCEWENKYKPHVSILYAPGNSAVVWNTGAAEADTITFSVLFEKAPVFPATFGDLGTLLYRAISGTNTDAKALWEQGGDVGSASDDSQNYRSAAIDNWGAQGFAEVTIVANKDGEAATYFKFSNPSASDSLAWFAQGNFMSSPYDNQSRSVTSNSWRPDGGNGREFYMSHNHGGCNVDAGWMVADSASGADPCSWENANTLQVIYSTADNHQAWSGNQVAVADNMEIYASVPAEWTYAFKIVDGGPSNTIGFWNDFGSYGMRDQRALDPANKDVAYRNPLLDAFFQYGGNGRVRFELYKDGAKLKTATFRSNAGRSTTDWFAQENLLSSDWGSLSTSSESNYFAVEGHASVGRRWFISRNYGGCDVDAGWLVIMDDDTGPCGWETDARPHTSILMAPGDDAVAWGGATHADTFAVYISFTE